MNRHRRSADALITVVVVVHFIIAAVHGQAHDGAVVPVSTAANIFIWTVIVAAPFVGVALLWLGSIATGSWVLATSLAGSLIFGVVNHFVLDSPDHVANVAAAWRTLFGTTALLLALTEALGSGLAFRRAAQVRMR